METELLDDRHADASAVRDELHDIARLNRLFGGTRAVVGETWMEWSPMIFCVSRTIFHSSSL